MLAELGPGYQAISYTEGRRKDHFFWGESDVGAGNTWEVICNYLSDLPRSAG